MDQHKIFYRAIDKAISEGKLAEPFSANDVNKCCPEFPLERCRSFLSKHIIHNRNGYLELFERVTRGRYQRMSFYVKRDNYIEILRPIFLPDNAIRADIIIYFAALLRVFGMEDKGWDPYAESRATLNDLNSLFKIDLPSSRFPDQDKTHWRLGLLLYTHIVEMDAPYEVIVNLLRFRLGDGYEPNPFLRYLTEKEKRASKGRGISTLRKIEIIKSLSEKSGLSIGSIFDDFYKNKLRNAISHSDYIITENKFRCRGGSSGSKSFEISFDELDILLLSAKAFIAAFFSIEHSARLAWGHHAGRAVPYDVEYKGMMEVLADQDDLLCGFKVHWPNGTDSLYRRTADGIEMENCMLATQEKTIGLNVGRYATKPGTFSPLVEANEDPVYTSCDGQKEPLSWPSLVEQKQPRN